MKVNDRKLFVGALPEFVWAERPISFEHINNLIMHCKFGDLRGWLKFKMDS